MKRKIGGSQEKLNSSSPAKTNRAGLHNLTLTGKASLG
jgi:hypothetical protein